MPMLGVPLAIASASSLESHKYTFAISSSKRFVKVCSAAEASISFKSALARIQFSCSFCFFLSKSANASALSSSTVSKSAPIRVSKAVLRFFNKAEFIITF